MTTFNHPNTTDRFQLPVDAIHAGLPLIDTKQTEIDAFCPAFFKGTNCEVERFRSLDGSCNNLDVSSRGAALNAMRRLIPADYADGMRKKKTNTRPTSRTCHLMAGHIFILVSHRCECSPCLGNWQTAAFSSCRFCLGPPWFGFPRSCRHHFLARLGSDDRSRHGLGWRHQRYYNAHSFRIPPYLLLFAIVKQQQQYKQKLSR